MAAAAHRINRVVFDLTAPNRAAFDRLSHHLRSHFDGLASALQVTLDQVDHAGGVIRLERIEVDLGRLDSSLPTGDALGRLLAERLADTLGQVLSATPAAASPPRDDIADLVRFIDTGAVPLPEPGGALAAMLAAATSWDDAAIARLAAELRSILTDRPATLRLVLQFPSGLIRRLILALAGGPAPAVRDVAPARDHGRPPHPLAPPPAELTATLIDAIMSLARVSGEPARDRAGSVLDMLDGRLSFPPEQPIPQAKPMQSGEREPDATITQPTDQAETIPVRAAGAVILHPFLATFFDRQGLLAAPGRFRDEDARARAVLLAFHAATGEDQAFEPDTILFKLLAGMRLAEPIPRTIDPTASEREAAEGLLSAVIEHWRRLGNTSPAGLREGFLSRPGRLERRPPGWLLTVEPRGVDLLLDDLPWTLSRVKTPFMADLLTVDWRQR